ncbi:hypothetical protein HDU97_008089 [Phlyctochytrium planicorne]|nr:hypothetical protein HDU97_008089 [Phlyctochytrium planicorne]
MKGAVSLPLRALVGYKKENERTALEFQRWLEDSQMRTVIIEGPSGIGKTTIMDTFLAIVSKNKIEECIIRISQEESITPFSSISKFIQSMVNSFLKEIHVNLDRKPEKTESTNLTPALAHTKSPTLVRALSNANMGMMLTAETLGIFLIRMNEDPALSPLLAPFFPKLSFTVSDYIKNLAPHIRNKLITALIARIIGRWAKSRKTVLVFDDMQVCASIYAFAVAESIAVDGFTVIGSLENHFSVKARGLIREDVRNYLCASLEDQGVEDVHHSVVELFMEKLASSPLALEFAVSTLLRKETFVVNDSVLFFDGGKMELVESILVGNVNRTIMLQFNRLNNSFQKFLRCASIHGQYFDALDVKTIMDINLTDDEILDLAQKEDTFSFLKRQSNQTPSATKKDTSFYFRHISIATAIYESISDDEKVRLHLAVAEMLESRMNEDRAGTQGNLLPLILHHYTLGEHVDKRLQFYEESSMYYEQKGYKKETAIVLLQFFEFLDSLVDPPEHYSNALNRMNWLHSLATAAFGVGYSDVMISTSRRLLKMAGVDIPIPGNVKPTLLVKRLLKLFILFKKTNGGRKPMRNYCPNEQLCSKVRVLVNRGLYILLMGTFGSVNVPAEFRLLCILELNIFNIVEGYKEKGLWAQSAAAGAYVFMMLSKPLCKIFYSAFQDALKGRPMVEFADYSVMFLAVALYFMPDSIPQIKAAVVEIQRYYEKLGDWGRWQITRNFLFYMKFPTSSEEARDMLLLKAEEVKSDDVFSAHFAGSLALQCMITYKDMEATEELIQYVEEILQALPFDTPGVFATATGRLWLAIISSDKQEVIKNLEVVVNGIDPHMTSSYLIDTAMFGLYTLWPFKTILDNEFSNDPKTLQKWRTDVLRLYKPLRFIPIKIKKYNTTDNAILLFDASAYIFAGKRKAAKRLLLKLLNPKNSTGGWREIDPKFFGLAFAGLWLLEGDEGHKREALTRFESINGKVFLDWIVEAKPLSMRCPEPIRNMPKSTMLTHSSYALILLAFTSVQAQLQAGLVIVKPYVNTVYKPGDVATVEWNYFPTGAPGILGEEVLEFQLQDLRNGMDKGVPLKRLEGSFPAKLKTANVTIPSDAPSGDFALACTVYNTYFSSPLIKIVSSNPGTGTSTLANAVISPAAGGSGSNNLGATTPPAGQRSQSNKIRSSMFLSLLPTFMILLFA